MSNVINENTSPCNDCSDSNPCVTTNLSQLIWNTALSSCQQALGLSVGASMAANLNVITDAICSLQSQFVGTNTCSSILVPNSYSNIGFTGTVATTLCDWMQAVNNKFGSVLDWSGDSGCFAPSPDATTIPEMVQAIIDKLCEDLYTTNSWLFLPLAGNTTSSYQNSYYMAQAAVIYWSSANGGQIAGLDGVLGGLFVTGGQNPSNDLNPIYMESPVSLLLSSSHDFSALTAASTTLAQNTMKGIYFITKSSVTSVYLPALSTLNIDKRVVTFSATILDSSTGAAFIYPSSGSGDTIQGIASFDMKDANSVTLIADKANGNWRIITKEVF